MLLNLGIRKAFHLHHLEFALCHTAPKIGLCCCNRRCKQTLRFAQRSTQKGARNSAEGSVRVLSVGGDAPQGSVQHHQQQLILAHQRPRHRLSSQERMQHCGPGAAGHVWGPSTSLGQGKWSSCLQKVSAC